MRYRRNRVWGVSDLQVLLANFLSVKKKRHHYVWRNYLRSWSNSKDNIPSLIKNENKIATPNLMGVAQQRFYYSLVEFSIEEEVILKEIIKTLSNDYTIEINLKYFDLFTSYSRLKRVFKYNKYNIIQEKKIEIEEKLDLMKSNIMEDFHADFENFGHKLIKVKKLEDLKFLEDEEALFKTFIFLCSQYVRTKKMQIAFSQKFENHYTILPKYFHIISFVLATGIATGLRFFKETKFMLIENISETDFITSDQPIINLKEDEKDENGNVKSFELYYPISPRIALKIHYNDEWKKFDNWKVNKEHVEQLNQIIFNKSQDFIFANNSKQLERYKNCL